MGHHHNHSHGHDHSEGNIKIAFLLNLTFTVIEIIGGLYTNSLAILSDALHDLGDSLSLGLSWYFQRLSKKGRSPKFSFGYKRFSLLGAIINSIVLVVGSVVVLSHALPQLWHPEKTDAQGMLYLAILGVVVNGLAVFRLRKGDSLNEKVVSLHLLEDVLGWVAVLIGSLIMMYFDAPIIDPILSILITAFVLFNVYKNIKESMRIILQGTPTDVTVEELEDKINSVDKVLSTHDCHLWSMDGTYHILTAHVVLDKNYNLEELSPIKRQIFDEVAKFNIKHSTLSFELESEICELENC